MKASTYFLIITLLFFGCSPKSEVLFDSLPNTYLIKSDFQSLPDFTNEKYSEVLQSFKNNCRSSKAKKIFGELCSQAKKVTNPKLFLTQSFVPYIITTKEDKQEGLLTGYYEPELRASLQAT
ncbi:MAG: MltA domain-containing protein [Sulfurimonas sp.]|nr:MltA domain-containing protein [Sulfurimonas sp.]